MKRWATSFRPLTRTQPRLFSTTTSPLSPISDAELKNTFDRVLCLGSGATGCVLAISGGPDSAALLRLFHRYLTQLRNLEGSQCGAGGPSIAAAVTVNHMLRPEAQAEAEGVGRLCQSLGIKHLIRRVDWKASLAQQGTDRPESSELQLLARSLRYSLLAQVCEEEGVDRLFLGHTADDQMETFLMRWGRASGIEGLKGMAEVSKRVIKLQATSSDHHRQRELVLCRPLLSFRKQRLIATCQHHGVPFFTDKSNKDRTYDRVRARDFLSSLDSPPPPSPFSGSPLPATTTTVAAAGTSKAVLGFEDLQRLHSTLSSTAAQELKMRSEELIHAVGVERLVAPSEGPGGRATAAAVVVRIPIEAWARHHQGQSGHALVVANAALSRLLGFVASQSSSPSSSQLAESATLVPQQKHVAWLAGFLAKLREAELQQDEKMLRRQREEEEEGRPDSDSMGSRHRRRQLPGDAPTLNGKWPKHHLLEGRVEVTVSRKHEKTDDEGNEATPQQKRLEKIRYWLELRPAV